MTTSYYFWGLQRMGLLRGREKIVYWCMPLILPCFLSSFYHFFFLSFSFSVLFFTLSFWLLSCHGLFFYFGYFLFLGPFLSLSTSLRCLLLSYHGFLHLGSSPLSSMAISSFYSELIQWDFSLLPLGLHQLFLACYGHSFSTTHQPIGCPTTTSTHNTFTAPLFILWQNSILFVLIVYLYL